jgi:hypothetical protein
MQPFDKLNELMRNPRTGLYVPLAAVMLTAVITPPAVGFVEGLAKPTQTELCNPNATWAGGYICDLESIGYWAGSAIRDLP